MNCELRITNCEGMCGSRAAGTAQPGSDVDIAVAAEVDISQALSRVRFELEESTIPYKIDLVDLNRTSADFKQQVLTEGVLIEERLPA